MTPPALLLGAAVLFWGWQTGLWWIAVPVAFAGEAARTVPWRWAFSEADFGRAWSLCVLLLVGIMAFLGLTTSTSAARQAVHTLVMWAPLTSLPLLLAQLYSDTGAIPAGVFLRSLRRRTDPASLYDTRLIHLEYPFAAFCVLSATAANDRSPWFFLALFGLTAWMLWSFRSRAFSVGSWAVLLIMAGGLGYAGHLGLHHLQSVVEQRVIEFMIGLGGGQTDPYKTHTAMGTVGSIKESDRIVMRVDLPETIPLPLLLREATYDRYQSSLPSGDGIGTLSRWYASSQSQLISMQPGLDGSTWTIQGVAETVPPITIASPLPNGTGVLALPSKAAVIEQLPVGELKRNRLGAVRVADGPEVVFFYVTAAQNDTGDGPPGESDLHIPSNEAPIISRIAAELHLPQHTPQKQLAVLMNYFTSQFHYATYTPNRPFGNTPVADFLLKTKSGHCEFFATATVLLLRAGGTPARYAVGYSAQEFSPLEGQYIVRARHAHTWAMAYVNGKWLDFDTTPSSWYRIEQSRASWWKQLQDLWAWLLFQIDKWRWSGQRPALTEYLPWLLIPLLFLLIYRVYRSRRVVRQGPPQVKALAVMRPGTDSDFYAIERTLAELGFSRHPAESQAAWLDRLQVSAIPSIRHDALKPIVHLHYRYRFDPKGLTSTERGQLASATRSWLSYHEKIHTST